MLIAILLVSNETHLTTVSGYKNLWPVYISIGNIRSPGPNTSTMHTYISITFLSIYHQQDNKLLWDFVEI